MYVVFISTDLITDDVENVAWAFGGSLNYESGLLKDIFSVGAELFTSQKIYGPEDKGGNGRQRIEDVAACAGHGGIVATRCPALPR